MKLSELQRKIQELIEIRGDIDVQFYDAYLKGFRDPKPFIDMGDEYGRFDLHTIRL